MDNNLSWAIYWASQGWKLFPSYWGVPKKMKDQTHMPLTSWSTPEGTTTDPQVLHQWFERWGRNCYYCVDIIRSDVSCLDIDTKHDKNGPEELRTLEALHGALPVTLIVTTPSGGLHYWFSGSIRNTLSTIAPGIDTPVMAPVPGSYIPGKGRYLINEVA